MVPQVGHFGAASTVNTTLQPSSSAAAHAVVRLVAGALGLLTVLGLSLPAGATSIGQCLNVEALMGLTYSQDGISTVERMIREQHPHSASLCFEMGWNCSVETVEASADSLEDGPCLREEVEGRCAEQGEDLTPASETSDELLGRTEPAIPLGTLALACFSSRSQCNGLPAPTPSKPLYTPTPTPPLTDALRVPVPGWIRTVSSTSHTGLAPSVGTRARVERPPAA